MAKGGYSNFAQNVHKAQMIRAGVNMTKNMSKQTARGKFMNKAERQVENAVSKYLIPIDGMEGSMENEMDF